MTQATSHKELTEFRKRTAWEMRLNYFTQQEIAKELQISQAAVSKLLKKSLADYHRNFMEEIDDAKQFQVCSIMMMAREAKNSWDRSKQCGPGTGGQYNQFGDVKYLKAFLDCLAEIRKILGVDILPSVNLDIDIQRCNESELQAILAASSLNEIEALQLPRK